MRKIHILYFCTLIVLSCTVTYVYFSAPSGNNKALSAVISEEATQKNMKKDISNGKKKNSRINEVNESKAIAGTEGERLLVTHYIMFYVNNGKILWKGQVIEKPVHFDEKVYVASGEYIFCTYPNGKICWKKKMSNNGQLGLLERNLVVYSGTNRKILNPYNGSEILDAAAMFSQ